MAALFVSDLHLSPERARIAAQFFAFLGGTARRAEALYILGDLFEYWAGDDDLGDAFNAGVIEALRGCAAAVPVSVMHGNRDFLLGERFAAAAGVRIIPDPTMIDLYGTPTLLAHGDTACTDDLAYQRFRAEVRTPGWIEAFLALPLAARKARIDALRSESKAEKQLKTDAIMDVNTGAIETLLREHGYPRLIHGHTHRPARHEHVVDGRRCERWVLGDWYERASYLRCDNSGIESVTL